MDEFKQNIQRWVELDNVIKRKSDEIKEYRLHKQEISKDIMDYAKSNQLQTSTIKIPDGQLRFKRTKQTQPLTLKYVQKCLEETIVSEEHVKQIMNHIKSSRDFTVKEEISRG